MSTLSIAAYFPFRRVRITGKIDYRALADRLSDV